MYQIARMVTEKVTENLSRWETNLAMPDISLLPPLATLFHTPISNIVAVPSIQPDLCYIKNMTDWKEFVTRTPEEYERWMHSVGRESAEFEILAKHFKLT